jgi:hypothetical protein
MLFFLLCLYVSIGVILGIMIYVTKDKLDVEVKMTTALFLTIVFLWPYLLYKLVTNKGKKDEEL